MLLYIVIILSYFILPVLLNRGSFSEKILKISLFNFTLIVFITEILSFFYLLNKDAIFTFWVIYLFFLIFSFFIKRKELKSLYFINNIKGKFLNLPLILVSIIIILLVYQSIIYPPNNWDTLTYHMTRIVYWISNENVNHFPTYTLRNLYQPPFSEFFNLQLNLLNGDDYLSTSLQIYFLILSALVIKVILENFNFSRNIIYLSILFCFTTTSIILQSTTPKNDIICGFFVLLSNLYLFKTYKEESYENIFLLGLSISLGMLTKGTFYIFIFPSIAIFILAVLIRSIKTKKLQKLLKYSVVLTLVIFINIGHFYRNYSFSGNIISVDKVENDMYSNKNMTIKKLTSNVLKNIGNQIGYPFTNQYDIFLYNFHYDYEIFMDNPEINFNKTKYQAPLKFETHEDLAPNTLHFFCIILFETILLFLFFKERKKIILLISFIIFSQFLLFSFYLKWQPWHSRLLIPFFMSGSIAFGIGVNFLFKNSKLITFLLCSIFYLNFIFHYLYNKTRPIIYNKDYTCLIKSSDSRNKKYFVNQPYLENEYEIIINNIRLNKYKNIGLEITDWEYPLFTDIYRSGIKINSINVPNKTIELKKLNSYFPDAVISNIRNSNTITYNGNTYKNISKKNNFLWLYEKIN